MELSTRRAEPSDQEVAGELLAAALAEGATRRGGPEALALWPSGPLNEPAVQAQLVEGACRGSSQLLILLARFEGVDVGLGVLQPAADGARVELAYVLEGARGVGVGDSLLEALIEEARAMGARWIDAVALPGDRATKSLYERGGLVAREITLRRSLEA